MWDPFARDKSDSAEDDPSEAIVPEPVDDTAKQPWRSESSATPMPNPAVTTAPDTTTPVVPPTVPSPTIPAPPSTVQWPPADLDSNADTIRPISPRVDISKSPAPLTASSFDLTPHPVTSPIHPTVGPPVVELPTVGPTVTPPIAAPPLETSQSMVPPPIGPGVSTAVGSTAGSLPPGPFQPNMRMAVEPSPTAIQGRGYKLWPLMLLALLTVVGSAAVSYFVANETTNSNLADSGLIAETSVTNPGTVVPPVNQVDPGLVNTSPPLDFSGEPFAAAAAKIEASVVQLTLGDGLGSGVIINSNGTILTAAHVVGANEDVKVRLSDGSIVDGEVLGAHVPTDVAVVKIDPTGRDLVAAAIADVDDIQVGQLAIAVGSPFGFEQTVTAGIISGVDRVVNSVSMVQTDAPINPGNSGGPLINLDGEVVGINDLIFTQSGTSAGVGFAIAIDLATLVADQILAGEEVQLALLGVETGPDPDGRAGALVLNVVPDSAAADAGILTGDLLVGIDGRPTSGGSQLRAQVIGSAPGTTITLDALRDGERLQLEATLGSTG